MFGQFNNGKVAFTNGLLQLIVSDTYQTVDQRVIPLCRMCRRRLSHRTRIVQSKSITWWAIDFRNLSLKSNCFFESLFSLKVVSYSNVSVQPTRLHRYMSTMVSETIAENRSNSCSVPVTRSNGRRKRRRRQRRPITY